MKIGCQDHPIADWESFADDRIAEMNKEAFDFWSKNRESILSFVDRVAVEQWKAKF